MYLNIQTPIFQITQHVQGLFYDALRLCEEELNFTTDVYNRFDGQWGSYNSATGQWTGMIHSILKQEIDIAIASLAITLERASAVQFLPPLAVESFSFAIKNPDAEDLSWETYLDQFSGDLWLAVLSVSIIVALISWIVDEVANHREGHVTTDCLYFCIILLQRIVLYFSHFMLFKDLLANGGWHFLPILETSHLSLQARTTPQEGYWFFRFLWEEL